MSAHWRIVAHALTSDNTLLSLYDVVELLRIQLRFHGL